jgi:prepilin-type N-terminal cleavage/methylation domain-containing protein
MLYRKVSLRSSSGVTLIELLVALALVGIVLAAAGTMLLQSYANEAAYREQNQAQQNARAAADIITDDLRGAKKDSVVFGTAAWNNPLRLTIYNDANPPQELRVFYWLDGNNLRRASKY